MKWESRKIRKARYIDENTDKVKILRKFLLLPKKINQEWRWLSTESYIQKFDYKRNSGCSYIPEYSWFNGAWWDNIEDDVIANIEKYGEYDKDNRDGKIKINKDTLLNTPSIMPTRLLIAFSYFSSVTQQSQKSVISERLSGCSTEKKISNIIEKIDKILGV